MNDVFNEQLVTRKPNTKDRLKKAGVVLVGLILVFVVFSVEVLMAFILPILVVILFFVVYFVRRFNLEYEYVFTNGDLDVDTIYNKQKRKHTLTVNVKSFITMVPLSNKDYANEVSHFTKRYDFSSGVITDQTYGIIYEHGKERIKLIIEPNEQMFKAIKAYIPRIIKK